MSDKTQAASIGSIPLPGDISYHRSVEAWQALSMIHVTWANDSSPA